MIKVLINEENHYKKLGLSLLISELLSENQDVIFLLPSDNEDTSAANIIFCSDWVTLNLYSSPGTRRLDTVWSEGAIRLTAHAPFLNKHDTLKDISAKIWKILKIINTTKDNLNIANLTEWPRGIKKHQQLSSAESEILILVGRGLSHDAISKIVNRSRKTVGTHYRNASRKLGLINRAEFYRYAAFIAQQIREERNTLCL